MNVQENCYKKRLLWGIFLPCFVIAVFCSSLSCYAQAKRFCLGTASEGGSYYRLGLSIKKILSENGIEIDVLPTKGSVENIELLDSGDIDLAIIQNDMAFSGRYGIDPFAKKHTNYLSVLPFYIEPVYVIVRNPDIKNIGYLDGLTVNVGEVGSGLYADALIILKSGEVWEGIQKKNNPPSEVPGLFKNGSIDAAFVNRIDVAFLPEIETGQLFVLSLSRNETEMLSSTFPYFSRYTFAVDGNDINTMSVKSILVARSKLPADDIYEITKVLHKNVDRLDFPDKDLALSITKTVPIMPADHWHAGSRRYYVEQDLIKSFRGAQVVRILVILLGIFLIVAIVMVLAFLILSRKYPHLIVTDSRGFRLLKKSYLFLVQHKYIFIVFTIVVLFLIDLMIIQIVEHDWAIRNNVVCKYDNRSFIDNIVWLFVFSGSGYSEDIFPDSLLGKILAALIPLISLSGLISVIGFFTSDKIKESVLITKGVKMKKVRDHIIVCSYNKNIGELLKNLTCSDIIRKKRRHIVLLAELGESNPLYKHGLDDEMVSYINGSATSRDDLSRANIVTADIVVVVADEGVDDPDAVNILKILTIEKFSDDLMSSEKRKKDIYTIAEIDNINNYQLARDAKVDEIIGFGGLRSKMLAQSILNPGLSCFINEIFTYDEYNETYSIVVGEFNGLLIGHTYDKLLFVLRKYDILLLSINVYTCEDTYHCEVKDCASDDASVKVITNPMLDREKKYEVKEKDILIVLAYGGDVIQNAKKKINKNDFL